MPGKPSTRQRLEGRCPAVPSIWPACLVEHPRTGNRNCDGSGTTAHLQGGVGDDSFINVVDVCLLVLGVVQEDGKVVNAGLKA